MTSELDETFRPPGWLRNRHVQSILPSLRFRRLVVVPRAKALIEASRELLLDCGDGVRLQAFHSVPPNAGAQKRMVVMLHGWEGSANSLYVLSLARQLFERGFEIVRLNLRDHGDTHHLNEALFHSCLLPEVVGAVRRLQQLFPDRRMSLAGFSLGGNFMLRVAAQAGEAGLDIANVVAVSPVLEPAETLDALESGFKPYHLYFIHKWSGSLRIKQAAWPKRYDFSELRRRPHLRHMTAELIRQFTSYPSLDAYLCGYAITGDRLAKLTVPSLLITSLDDPIIPASGLKNLARPRALHVIVTRYGGHCGFLDGLSGSTWAERKAIEALECQARVNLTCAVTGSEGSATA